MISIIVPVYNRVEMLERCIQSVLCQKIEDLELLLVDDHSTDSTWKQMIQYSKLDSRVRAFSLKEGRGVSAARNLGILKAKGSYLMFMDSDDYIEEKTVEYLYQVMQRTNSDVVAVGLIVEDKNQSEIKASDPGILSVSFTGEEMLLAFDQSGFAQYCCWGKLIRTELVKQLRFQEGVSIAGDVLFMMELYGSIKKLVYAPARKYHCVVHETNIHRGCYRPGLEYNEMNCYEKAYDYYEQRIQDIMARHRARERLFLYKLKVLRRIGQTEKVYADEVDEIQASCRRDAKEILLYGSWINKIRLLLICLNGRLYISIYRMYLDFSVKKGKAVSTKI